MREARIVVTCNPSHWEGDFRLFEAMLSGALVFVDEMCARERCDRGTFSSYAHVLFR